MPTKKRTTKKEMKSEMKENMFTRGKNEECCTSDKGNACGSGGCMYGFGFIGAVIYYISTANTFWMGVLGVLKALVWPAFLVFELLKMVGA